MTSIAPEPQRMFDVSAIPHVLSLAERFTLPPFTVLNAREGWWQDRKRLWIGLGMESEEGRDARTFAEAGGNDEVSQKILAVSDGISIFDPVLTEMCYRWFCPPAGRILDPFAGGSVRGIVAGFLGYDYTGIDLSDRQIEANQRQGRTIELSVPPEWIHGDSRDIVCAPGEPEFDFVFTCPPYFDLERYSDAGNDLSAMSWDDFRSAYRAIIGGSVGLLRPDRFAAIVVGEVRDRRTGVYRDLVGETIRAFVDAGAGYYNELILVTSVGTLPLRVAKQFSVSRKLGKTHQTCLVFVKGDPAKAAKDCGVVPIHGLDQGEDDEE